MASVYEHVVKVISKHPSKRTDDDVLRLLPWFKKKSELFSTITQDVIVDIIKNCEFSIRPRDNIVIKQGERGDCFYILIKGLVSVYINNTLADEDDDGRAEENTSYDHLYTDKGTLDRTKFGSFIATLGAGKSFGELALINKNCIRNASILADETTDLIVINRELFNRCLHAAHTAEMEEKNRFVRENPLFQNWQLKHKKQLAYSLRKVKIAFNECVVKQGDQVDGLCFLLSGQATVVIDPSQHPQQYPQFYPLEKSEVLQTSEELDESISSSSKLPLDHGTHEKCHDMTPSSHRRRERPKKVVELSIVTDNEVVGDTEMGLSLKTYAESVVSTQETAVFIINQRNFDRLVLRRNQRTLDLLREYAILKWQNRLDRLHHDEIPLLKTLIDKMHRANHPSSARKRKDNRFLSSSGSGFSDFVPHRGPLIDLYGPGTVFYRNKLREQAKEKQKNKFGFRGFQAAVRVPAASYDIFDNGPQLKPMCESDVNSVSDLSENAIKTDGNSQQSYNSDDDEMTRELPLHPESSFVDYQSSNEALCILEEKIKNWHQIMSQTCPKNGKVKKDLVGTVPLKRVHLDKDKLLFPGSKILLKKKKPPYHLPLEAASQNLTRSHETQELQQNEKNRDTIPSHLTLVENEFNDKNHPMKGRMRKITNRKPLPLHHASRTVHHEQKQTSRSYTPVEYDQLRHKMLMKQKELDQLKIA